MSETDSGRLPAAENLINSSRSSRCSWPPDYCIIFQAGG
jgi:hypothetical protein